MHPSGELVDLIEFWARENFKYVVRHATEIVEVYYHPTGVCQGLVTTGWAHSFKIYVGYVKIAESEKIVVYQHPYGSSFRFEVDLWREYDPHDPDCFAKILGEMVSRGVNLK